MVSLFEIENSTPFLGGHSPRQGAGLGEWKAGWMPCSPVPSVGTLHSEPPGLPSTASLPTFQNHSAQASHALDSAGQSFPQLWFPKGRHQLLLGSVFLQPPQLGPGSGRKLTSLFADSSPSPDKSRATIVFLTLESVHYLGEGGEDDAKGTQDRALNPQIFTSWQEIRYGPTLASKAGGR